jgi:hypothetical protein
MGDICRQEKINNEPGNNPEEQNGKTRRNSPNKNVFVFMNKNRISGIITCRGAGDESIKGKLYEFMTINSSQFL